MQPQPQIGIVQLVSLYVTAIVGVGVLSLPRDVAEYAKQDAWISVLAAGCIFAVSAWFATATARLYPQKTFDMYIQEILGPMLGRLLLLFISLYCMMIAGLEIRRFAVVMKIFVLDRTPLEAVVMTLLIGTYITGRYGMEPVLNFIQTWFVPTKLGFIIFILFSYGVVDFHELRPVLEHIPGIFAAMPVIGFAFTGPEILVGFIFPLLYQPAKDKIILLTFVTYGIVLLLYTIVMVVCIGAFSAEELHYLLAPVAMLLRTVELYGGFLERLDALFLVTYIPVSFTAILVWHYFASFSLTKLIGQEEQRPVLLLLVPILYVVALIAADAVTSLKIGDAVSKVAFWFAVAGVPAIWLAARLRKGREKRHA